MNQTWTGEPAHFVLRSDGEGHGEHGGDPVQRDERAGSGGGGSSDDAAAGCREAAAAGNAHLGERVASPNARKDCTRAALAESLRNGPIAYKWKKLVGEADPYLYMLLEEVTATQRTRRTAEWTRRNSPGTSSCSAGKSFARSSTAWQHGKLLELLPKREHEMKDNVATDGYVKLSTLSKKLIDRWSGEGNPSLNHHT